MATLTRGARPGGRKPKGGAGAAAGQGGASVREVCLLAVSGEHARPAGARVVLGGRRYRVAASALRDEGPRAAAPGSLRYVHLTADG